MHICIYASLITAVRVLNTARVFITARVITTAGVINTASEENLYIAVLQISKVQQVKQKICRGTIIG